MHADIREHRRRADSDDVGGCDTYDQRRFSVADNINNPGNYSPCTAQRMCFAMLMLSPSPACDTSGLDQATCLVTLKP